MVSTLLWLTWCTKHWDFTHSLYTSLPTEKCTKHILPHQLTCSLSIFNIKHSFNFKITQTKQFLQFTIIVRIQNSWHWSIFNLQLEIFVLLKWQWAKLSILPCNLSPCVNITQTYYINVLQLSNVLWINVVHKNILWIIFPETRVNCCKYMLETPVQGFIVRRCEKWRNCVMSG